MTGPSKKLPCRFAQSAEARATRASCITVPFSDAGRRGIVSQNETAPKRNSQLRMGGRASQCRLVVESMGAANRHASRKFPPAAQFSRNHIHTAAPIAIVYKN